MATINLGRVKPVFRGAYNNSTAYVVDDIVTSSDETFICIAASTGNATSNATYWTKLAAKGTNGTDGTDVGTVITTQGDILYRDGSGLARLAAGTSGQFLKTQGSGANPVWGTVVAGLVQVVQNYTTSVTNSSTANTWIATNLSVDITPTSSSNKILILANGTIDTQTSGRQVYASIFRDSTNLGATNQGLAHNYGDSARIICPYGMMWLDNPSSTSQITYKVYGRANGQFEVNGQSARASIIAMEVAV